MTQPNTTAANASTAIVIDGVPYLRNAKGDLTAVGNIKPMDLLMDEMVRKVASYAEDLSAELARFVAHTDADIAALDALIAQNYGVEPRETKGNRTFVSFDGMMKVQVAVSDRIVLGPELQAAKAVLDALILERGEGVDPFLLTLVKRAFNVDQEGRVDVRAILALRRMEVDDDRWADFCRAIDDAVRVVGSKRYIRIYRRDSPDAQWRMVPLDLAAVEPSPAAFERRSLRRQVEEHQDIFRELWGVLDGLYDLRQQARFIDVVEVVRDLVAILNDVTYEVARLSNLPGEDASIPDSVGWAVNYVVQDLHGLASGQG